MQANDWIKCSDRLPFTEEDLTKGKLSQFECIVTNGIEVGLCAFEGAIYKTSEGDKRWTAWNSYGDIRAYAITHWMPLPKPPEDL